MKSVYLFSLTAFFLFTMVFAAFADNTTETEGELASHQEYLDEMTEPEEKKYVEVTTHFPNVYKELDPTSDIIIQPQKGDFLELISEGQRWFKVRTNDQVGFIEARAGKVVDKRGSPLVPIIISIFSVLALSGFVTWGAIIYYRKRKTA